MMQYIVLRYDSLVIRARWRRKRKGVIDYPTLAELRYRIRKFLRVREVAARAAGVEPQQYLVLLQLKGLEDRRPPTIGVLAERLQIRHHSVVELVDRLARRGMVARRRDTRDRRGVAVELRAKGRAVLRRLALQSLADLETQGPALVSVLRRLIPRSTPRRPGRAPRGTRKRAPR
jgi:DNA-binding MarR family transcriptional regulator